MSKVTQKEAVYQAICNVTGFNGDGKVEMSKEQRSQVNTILFEGFRSGSIELDREYTDSDLKSYVSGLQSNWLRKDKRLNGGVKYEAKNPGSRAGSTDPELKAMKALIQQPNLTDDERAEIQTYIDAKVATINAAKAKVNVDMSALPEGLTKFLSK